jgi:hypothetical protein
VRDTRVPADNDIADLSNASSSSIANWTSDEVGKRDRLVREGPADADVSVELCRPTLDRRPMSAHHAAKLWWNGDATSLMVDSAKASMQWAFRDPVDVNMPTRTSLAPPIRQSTSKYSENAVALKLNRIVTLAAVIHVAAAITGSDEISRAAMTSLILAVGCDGCEVVEAQAVGVISGSFPSGGDSDPVPTRLLTGEGVRAMCALTTSTG